MKKVFILIFLLCLAVVPIFANGQDETDGMDGEENITIRVLTRTSGSDPHLPTWEAAKNGYMEMHPNVIIQDDSVSQEAAYNNKLKTDIATGNLPNIFYEPGVISWVKYAKNNLIMDVSPIMEDKEWFEGIVDGAFEMWNFTEYGVPGYYGVPYAMAPEVIVYNKEIFARAGIATPPETMEDLYIAIDKLKAIGVTPWSCGAKSTWRTGHIHNYLLYKWAGVEKATALGSRNAKWTDPEVVQSLQFLKDLKARGAFMDNFEGIDYDMEKSYFFNEQTAMILNGSWFIGDCINSEIADKLGTFPFPYFKEKPEYKGHMVNFPQGFYVKKNMSEKEKEASLGFLKYYIGKEIQAMRVRREQAISSRKDLDLSGIELSELYVGYTDVLKTATMLGGDSFQYDPLTSMQDRTRNSIIGMLLSGTAEQAAKEIQEEIDQNS